MAGEIKLRGCGEMEAANSPGLLAQSQTRQFSFLSPGLLTGTIGVTMPPQLTCLEDESGECGKGLA